MALDRRSFLKVLGSGSGVAAFSCSDREAADHLAPATAGDELRDADLTWGKAPCRFCGTGCGVEVGVHEGRVKAVRGDQASPVNSGLLCVKGYHLPAFLYGEDRLTHPIRRHPDGREEQISWEAALDLVAEHFGNALEQHGPNSVAVYGSGQWTVFDGYAALKWSRAACARTTSIPMPACAWPARSWAS